MFRIHLIIEYVKGICLKHKEEKAVNWKVSKSRYLLESTPPPPLLTIKFSPQKMGIFLEFSKLI